MDTVEVVVRRREGVAFSGRVFAVSSTNEIGNFDVLPNHANFISTIRDLLTIHHTKTRQQDFKVESGVLRAKGNLIEVYIGI